MNKIFFIVTVIISTSFVYGEEPKSKTAATLTLSTARDCIFRINHEITIPFLTGENFLFAENSLTFISTFEISPISANTEIEMLLQPIAFMEFNVGGKSGSGWNLRSGARGLAKNKRKDDNGHDNQYSNKQLDGIVYNGYAGSELKFDMDAIIPGKWNHIICEIYQEVYYRALTSAHKGESWVWENDDGENRNGFHHYSWYYFGYKTPTLLKDIGVFLETDKSYYNNNPDGKKSNTSWGNNLTEYTFGPVAKIELTPNIGIDLIAQWRTVPNYTHETKNYGYYIDREIKPEHPRKTEFYRFLFDIAYAF